jgi:hypothetical protein
VNAAVQYKASNVDAARMAVFEAGDPLTFVPTIHLLNRLPRDVINFHTARQRPAGTSTPMIVQSPT